jgi:truncated hemoglobin YjbI
MAAARPDAAVLAGVWGLLLPEEEQQEQTTGEGDPQEEEEDDELFRNTAEAADRAKIRACYRLGRSFYAKVFAVPADDSSSSRGSGGSEQSSFRRHFLEAAERFGGGEEDAARRFSAFLVQVLGGPPLYRQMLDRDALAAASEKKKQDAQQQKTGTSIRRGTGVSGVHNGIPITRQSVARWMALFRESLAERPRAFSEVIPDSEPSQTVGEALVHFCSNFGSYHVNSTSDRPPPPAQPAGLVSW